jgi:UPF0716 family protein affecting phage T7 exclusion
MKGNVMKTKFMLIISILLLVAASIILLKGYNSEIVTALLMIAMILNLIRGIIILWNERRVK